MRRFLRASENPLEIHTSLLWDTSLQNILIQSENKNRAYCTFSFLCAYLDWGSVSHNCFYYTSKPDRWQDAGVHIPDDNPLCNFCKVITGNHHFLLTVPAEMGSPETIQESVPIFGYVQHPCIHQQCQRLKESQHRPDHGHASTHREDMFAGPWNAPSEMDWIWLLKIRLQGSTRQSPFALQLKCRWQATHSMASDVRPSSIPVGRVVIWLFSRYLFLNKTVRGPSALHLLLRHFGIEVHGVTHTYRLFKLERSLNTPTGKEVNWLPPSLLLNAYPGQKKRSMWLVQLSYYSQCLQWCHVLEDFIW